MSLVGPRPERYVFIKEFEEKYHFIHNGLQLDPV